MDVAAVLEAVCAVLPSPSALKLAAPSGLGVRVTVEGSAAYYALLSRPHVLVAVAESSASSWQALAVEPMVEQVARVHLADVPLALLVPRTLAAFLALLGEVVHSRVEVSAQGVPTRHVYALYRRLKPVFKTLRKLPGIDVPVTLLGGSAQDTAPWFIGEEEEDLGATTY